MHAETSPADCFTTSRNLATELLAWIGGDEAVGLDHAELEARLDERGRQLLHQMFADQMDLRAST